MTGATTTDRPLEGRIALVTGASRGIGRAIALTLARRGAHVAIGYRSDARSAEEVAALCADQHVETLLLPGDLAERDVPAALCTRTVERFGGLDILVNNAAVVVEDLLATLSDDDLEAMLALNVAGLVRLSRAALRPMLRRRGGSIINLSSVTARQPSAGHAVYAGTKGFVEAFTRALAAEIGRKGVRVNAVAPGVIETDMSKSARALAGDALRERVPLGRLGTPEDVAALVAFLASDEAAYVTGAVVSVDGAYGGGRAGH